MSKLDLTLTDPVKAQEQAFEILGYFNQASPKQKQITRRALQTALTKAQTSNNTLVASIYRQLLLTIEGYANGYADFDIAYMR